MKLLGLLGSDHDGERATAGAKADALVRKLGLTWADVIVLPAPRRASSISATDAQQMASYCHRHYALLTGREFDFIRSIRRWHGDLTERQASWLCSIYARLHQGAGR